MGPLMGLLGAGLGSELGILHEPSAAGIVSAAIGDAVSYADDIAAMGGGLLYLAPEYLYREGRRVP
jgi:hypothetical protein